MNESTRPSMLIDSSQLTTSTSVASTMLQQGQLLAYPTESVWGIGCDAYNEEAVKRILSIKQRPIDKGMIVITDSIARIAPLLACLSPSQRQQVLDSWEKDNQRLYQQAHTWLLPIRSIPSIATDPNSAQLNSANNAMAVDQEKPSVHNASQIMIPNWITGEHDSVAVRVIAHPLIKQLCEQMVSAEDPFGFIVSTSCNPSGQSPARNFEQAYGYFGNDIGYLNAPTLGYTQPSQIRDAVTGEIIR